MKRLRVVQSVTIAACTNLTSYFGANYGCYGLESWGVPQELRRIGAHL
ncbi:MAG: hypothetical protein IPO94_06670 [Saprospiraceae bacterium]|nr:hypothetical protein [Saprospiraceae bacterium]